MTKVFYISDTHFCHVKLAKVRGFNSVEEHNEHIINKWNSVVGEDDIVWVLGDIFLNSTDESIARILPRLNGRKRAVLGNHDTPRRIKIYINYFEKVCAYHEIHFAKSSILLSHIPVHRSQLDRWEVNIHGHMHSKSLWSNKYINVSCENIDYTPKTLDELKGCQIWKKIKGFFK